MKAVSKFFIIILTIGILSLCVTCSSRNSDKLKEEPLNIRFPQLKSEAQGEFYDILGCDGYYVDRPTPAYQVMRHYYTQDGVVIAASFGFPDLGEDIALDIDGDGVRELICNIVYGDGAERVRIYRLRNDSIEVGTVDESFFEAKNAESRSIRERFEPASGIFVFTYTPLDNLSSRVSLEYDSLELFTFYEFSELQLNNR